MSTVATVTFIDKIIFLNVRNLWAMQQHISILSMKMLHVNYSRVGAEICTVYESHNVLRLVALAAA